MSSSSTVKHAFYTKSLKKSLKFEAMRQIKKKITTKPHIKYQIKHPRWLRLKCRVINRNLCPCPRPCAVGLWCSLLTEEVEWTVICRWISACPCWFFQFHLMVSLMTCACPSLWSWSCCYQTLPSFGKRNLKTPCHEYVCGSITPLDQAFYFISEYKQGLWEIILLITHNEKV